MGYINPLNKKNLDFYIEMVLEAGMVGKSLDVFLLDMLIRKSDWDKYVKKNKKLRIAINDAANFSKGVAQKRVNRLMKDNTINSQIAKMYLERCAGWSIDKDLSNQTTPTIIIKVGKTTKELLKEEEKNGDNNI